MSMDKCQTIGNIKTLAIIILMMPKKRKRIRLANKFECCYT